ncbi:kinase kinase kinase [Aspergillus sclerotialis]|uniref:Kinase kinase kinase n=1 Tax=Aspergillus sclerotialis TaxID=2070753 RepID=A0A3A2ZIY2_9EURO|nr:kinase kinase kinase [Aspergillus sclerotialis]
MDRVLSWLVESGFSKEWQVTFKALKLEGAAFHGLFYAPSGRPIWGQMGKEVYPRLKEAYISSGRKWDNDQVREEAKRMRRLVRQIKDDTINSQRQDYQTPDGKTEASPNLPQESTPQNRRGPVVSEGKRRLAHTTFLQKETKRSPE